MRYPILLSLGILAAACGESSSPAGPTPVVESSAAITAVSPASASTVAVPDQYPFIFPGGVVLPPGSGLVSVGVSLRSAHEVPWARLNVYLLTGNSGSDYCGENSPDAPTWNFLTSGWATPYTVTGFRVSRLPCDVTGILAVLHMRNNGLIAPPTASETIARSTFPVSFRINR